MEINILQTILIFQFFTFIYNFDVSLSINSNNYFVYNSSQLNNAFDYESNNENKCDCSVNYMYNLQKNENDTFIFYFIDLTIILSSVGYYFLINGKQGNKNTKILIALSYSILVISKYFSLIINENQFFFKKKFYNYIKLNYLTFCILFLFSFDYYINIYYSSSLFTKIFYMILIFIMTFLHNKIVMKVRIILYGIHFFEFLPEIRKFYQSFSNKSCYISYFLFTIYNIINLFYISENRKIFFILIFNVFVIVIYPFIFNYYYKKEKW